MGTFLGLGLGIKNNKNRKYNTPYLLHSTILDSTSIQLDWANREESIDGTRIYYRIGNSDNFTLSGSVLGTVNSYIFNT